MKWLFLILTFMSINALAQTEEENVQKPVNNLFNGMKLKDSTLLREAFADGAIMQTVYKNKEGIMAVHSETVDNFIATVTKPRKEIFDERITFDVIRIDADLAIAWTPYKFYIDEKFSHCGVNSFQLVKLHGEWKIQYVIDTRRKEGCL